MQNNFKIIVFDSRTNLSKLSRQILKNEPKIIKKYPPRGYHQEEGDGGTDLGLDSLTSRFYYFNVLKWWGTGLLRREIRKGYETYNNIRNTPLYVQCWANVMRKGQQINSHNHTENRGPKDLLSGHLCVQVDGFTSTYYQGDPIQNKNGQITLFPGYMYHWTDKYMGNSERITIAFDIRSEKYFERDIYPDGRKHWIKI